MPILSANRKPDLASYNLINLPLEIESDGLCEIAQARTA
jgi:hypothetical protein